MLRLGILGSWMLRLDCVVLVLRASWLILS
jgi:hypothetical protein